jgi:hypothetical protein
MSKDAHVTKKPLVSMMVAAALVGGGWPAFAGGSHAGLRFSPNTFAYDTNYGEPGLSMHGRTVYVTTPGDGGAVLAKSTDEGRTWTKLPTVQPPSTSPGQFTSGGDSDVAVAQDGTVYAGDLDLDGITVSKSTNGGRTFTQQVFISSTSDREWLATDGQHGDNVYVAWHELATGTILVEISHDGGATFSPPHIVYSEPTTIAESGHNGTSIGNITTDGKGHVYITYGVTRVDTTDTTYGTPPISDIHVSASNDGGNSWTDYEVNPGAADANYGNFWMSNAVDTAGNVYAVYSGYAHKGQPMHVWLQESSDHGAHWTAPYRVDDAGGQDLFGWVAGGGPGVGVVAWYHTDAASKDSTNANWTVKVAQVRGLTTRHPWEVVGTASDHVMHHGAICTLGLFCGVLPGSAPDRTLLDFFKVTVSASGRPAVVWSDNNRVDGGGHTGVGFAEQIGGPSAWSRTGH